MQNPPFQVQTPSPSNRLIASVFVTVSSITFGVSTACLYLQYHPNTAVIASVTSYLLTVFTFPFLTNDEK